jgi:hypothetical protein
MRDAPLTVLKGGINRLRTKGGARADNLYDLLNGYLTEDGTVHVRPGSFLVATLPEATYGLVYFNGSRHTFASSSVAVPTGYTLHVLFHPEYDPDDDDPTQFELAKVHFAEPFLGFLYVVAEFADGQVFHYWLQTGGTWEADTVYNDGDVVEPTVPNGLAYRATRLGSPLPSWAPNVARTEGPPPDQIEPTEYNGYFYTVVDTIGSNPQSGTTEPDWPTEEGAQIFEDTEGVVSATPATTAPPSTQTPTSDVVNRYRRDTR